MKQPILVAIIQATISIKRIALVLIKHFWKIKKRQNCNENLIESVFFFFNLPDIQNPAQTQRNQHIRYPTMTIKTPNQNSPQFNTHNHPHKLKIRNPKCLFLFGQKLNTATIIWQNAKDSSNIHEILISNPRDEQ